VVSCGAVHLLRNLADRLLVHSAGECNLDCIVPVQKGLKHILLMPQRVPPNLWLISYACVCVDVTAPGKVRPLIALYMLITGLLSALHQEAWV